jgi:hypothetical protein
VDEKQYLQRSPQNQSIHRIEMTRGGRAQAGLAELLAGERGIAVSEAE